MQYPAPVKFAAWFQEQLKRRDLTQAAFARRSGIPQSTINTWWQGQRVPDPASCDLIADVLGLDLDLVLWQAGHRPLAETAPPDDPRMVVRGWVDRIDWAKPGRLELMERIMLGWIGDDRKERI